MVMRMIGQRLAVVIGIVGEVSRLVVDVLIRVVLMMMVELGLLGLCILNCT